MECWSLHVQETSCQGHWGFSTFSPHLALSSQGLAGRRGQGRVGAARPVSHWPPILHFWLLAKDKIAWLNPRTWRSGLQQITRCGDRVSPPALPMPSGNRLSVTMGSMLLWGRCPCPVFSLSFVFLHLFPPQSQPVRLASLLKRIYMILKFTWCFIERLCTKKLASGILTEKQSKPWPAL